MDGSLVRAQVENAHGSVTSEPATLSVTTTAHPGQGKPRG
jgi:hypothetical protein